MTQLTLGRITYKRIVGRDAIKQTDPPERYTIPGILRPMRNEDSKVYWLVRQGQLIRGPYSTEQLRALAVDGVLSRATEVCQQGKDRWVKAGQLNLHFPDERDSETVTVENAVADPLVGHGERPQATERLGNVVPNLGLFSSSTTWLTGQPESGEKNRPWFFLLSFALGFLALASFLESLYQMFVWIQLLSQEYPPVRLRDEGSGAEAVESKTSWIGLVIFFSYIIVFFRATSRGVLLGVITWLVVSGGIRQALSRILIFVTIGFLSLGLLVTVVSSISNLTGLRSGAVSMMSNLQGALGMVMLIPLALVVRIQSADARSQLFSKETVAVIALIVIHAFGNVLLFGLQIILLRLEIVGVVLTLLRFLIGLAPITAALVLAHRCLAIANVRIAGNLDLPGKAGQ